MQKVGALHLKRDPENRRLCCVERCDQRSTIDLGGRRMEVSQTDFIRMLPRKEVIQPHLPVRLPCYDFTPITDPTLDACLPRRVSPAASGVADFRGVTGGVYKTRE